jgi:hypothetical protein
MADLTEAIYLECSDRQVEMARLYAEQGLSYAQIGERYGITRQRVGQLIGDLGLAPGRAARSRAEHEIAVRAAHARLAAGETTREAEIEAMGYKNWDSLYSAFRELGLKVERQHEPAPHGTDTRYRKCRDDDGRPCEACRKAHSEVQGRLRGRKPPKHGTVSGYQNYRCRCKRCVAAARRDRRAKKRRRRESKHAQ